MEFITKYLNETSNNNENTQITPATILNLFKKIEIKQHYKRHPDEYCELLVELINLIVDKDEFVTFINNNNVFDNSLIECEQFRIEFLDSILIMLIESATEYGNDSIIFNSISNLVKKCIFDKNIQSFDCYFNQHPTEKCTDEHEICRKVFEFLQVAYSEPVASCSFKIIFESFCTSFENNFNLNYKMLIIMFNLIGFKVKNHFKLNDSVEVDISMLDFNRTLEITNQLFECLVNLKIDDNNHKIDDITINDFITNIVKSIIPLTQHPNDCCYDIISNVIEFNPLIVVSIIDEIIVYMIVTDNSAMMEKYCQVFVKIFELFSKLYRVKFFLSRLMRVLKTNYYDGRRMNKTIYEFSNIKIQMKPICYNIDEILPKIVLDTFTKCVISNISIRPIFKLLKTIMFHFNEVVEEMQQNYNKPLIYIEVVTTLLCQFLSSVRMAEHTTTLIVVKKFHEDLNELGGILNKFATILLHQEHNHTLMTTFLNVCHTWGEIYMILAYYHPNDVALIKTDDNDNTACNITYLHYYLTKQQWCLISERVMNFGEKPCKGIMYKLMIQKLRAMTIFDEINDDVITPITKELYTKFDNDIVDISAMKFVVNHVINRLSPTIMIELCDRILNDLLNDRNSDLLKQSHIYDSQLIINGLLCNIFMKINKLLKQKRRHDDKVIKKSLLTKIMKLPLNDLLFDEDLTKNIPMILQFFNDHTEQSLDIKIDDDKIFKLIDILKKLPIVSGDENMKKIVFLLLLALQCDLYSSNCSDDLKEACETVIIGVAQCCKLPPIQIDSTNLLKIIITKFNRFDTLYGYLVDKIFKNHRFIPEFQSHIDYLTENLDDDKHLKCTMITLETIRKAKSNRMEDETKSTCTHQESVIYKKLFKLLKTHEINSDLIQPYALTLKHMISNNNEKLLTLKARLDEALQFVFNNSDDNVKSGLSLFTTILNNKSIISCDGDLVLKMWHYVQTVNTDDHCSHLISSIVMQIADEEFPQYIKDLIQFTTNLIDDRDYNAIFKCMNTWSKLISCDLNLKKTATFLAGFEKLLHKLVEMVKTIDYRKDVFDETTKLLIKTIKTNRLALTSDILDSFFVYTTVLITISKQSNFVHLFNLSISTIERLLIHRDALIMDRLSVYLLQYRLLLKHLCLHANSNSHEQQQQQQIFIDELSNCALQLEKLTRTLITHPKDIARITPYLISDILMQYEQRPIHPQIKLHLNNCLYTLISLCDQHAVQFLMTFLSNTSTTIFKVVYRNYKKYYQFKGKV